MAMENPLESDVPSELQLHLVQGFCHVSFSEAYPLIDIDPETLKITVNLGGNQFFQPLSGRVFLHLPEGYMMVFPRMISTS